METDEPAKTLTINHRERQLMQYLGSGSWVKVSSLPSALRTVEILLRKGWIEKREDIDGMELRMTPEGREAKSTPVKVGKSR